MWFRLFVLSLAVVTAEDLEWWRTATLYEVYPRSFKDSDGDGVGDLKGIIQNADYFKELGVDAIWLSPINTSPMVDFGYDIANFTAVDPLFGTMEDFDKLMAKLKQIGVKLLIDFVPNHTSDEHEWFQISKNPAHPLHQDFRDFYVWHDANGTVDGEPILPNNWLSIFGGPAWTWCEARRQFYLHQFAPGQPELNFRNKATIGNITAVMYFWLSKGVDGFRLDAAPHLFEDANFTNEPLLAGMTGDTWFALNHTYTMHLPETIELLKYWSDLINQWGQKDGTPKVVLLESSAGVPLARSYYGTGKLSMQIPFNFMLMGKNYFVQPQDFKYIIDQWMSVVPSDSAANWVSGNHDQPRVANLYGLELVDTISLLLGVLPGIKVVYYGEEIAMENTPVSWNRTVDPMGKSLGPNHYQEKSRDSVRSPMQWDDSLNAGFSKNITTWLPVNPNYWWLNVAAQRAAPVSHLKVFQGMSKARKDPVLQRGDLNVIVPDENTLIVVRRFNGSYFALVVNLGVTPVTYTSQNMFDRQGLDVDSTIVVGSVNSGYMPGTNFKKGSMLVTLRSKAAVLLRSGYSSSASSCTRNQLFYGITIIGFILVTLL